MIKTRIIELYYKNLKKPTILNGLVLHPFFIDNKIIWELENPKDLSYSSYVVEANLEDLILDFFTWVGVETEDLGMDWGVISVNYCRLKNESDVYINNELRQKINESLENLQSINFKTVDGKLDSECFVKNWYVNYADENIYFGVDLELNYPKIDNVDVSYDELDDYLKDYQYDDDSWQIETELLDEQISLIISDKNLFNDNFMIYNGSVTYYDPFGIRLGY